MLQTENKLLLNKKWFNKLQLKNCYDKETAFPKPALTNFRQHLVFMINKSTWLKKKKKVMEPEVRAETAVQTEGNMIGRFKVKAWLCGKTLQDGTTNVLLKEQVMRI